MAEINVQIAQDDSTEIEINQLFDHIIFCINERRVSVLTQYRSLRDNIASRTQVRARKEKELIGARTELENRIQMNELREFQVRILTEIEQKLAEIRAPLPSTRVVLRIHSEVLQELIAGLGEVLEEELPTTPNYLAMRPTVTVVKEGRTPGKLFYVRDVAIDPNDRIFVSEAIASHSVSHSRISVFSGKGEFLTSFKHRGMVYPHGLAMYDGKLYVTDIKVHAVFQFKMDTDFTFVKKQGVKGSQIGNFYYPYNLSISNHGDVFVADCNNNRVQILHHSLRHLRNLTEQPINWPRDVKLTDDEVYVLCHDSPCVQVFSHVGERLRSLVSMGKSMQVFDSWFFCLDSAENILISDSSTHQIKIFSKEDTISGQ